MHSSPDAVSSQTKRRFNLNRAQVVDENFVEFVRAWTGSGESASSPERLTGVGSPETILDPESGLTIRDAIELFESQMISRQMDIVSREMRARNEGFYTIGSSGHEGNAVVGRITRHTDIAFLHYRSGAFMAERSRKVPGIDFVRDTMLSFAASTEDPIAAGRHKVWGSVPLWVPPQTSTIASHLPKSVGTALSIARAKRFHLPLPVPQDSIVVCSFGDATANHAVAQTAFNAACYVTHQKLPVPILMVCEDNGLGISVETPPGWIEAQFRSRYGLTYFQADGLDMADAFRVSHDAIAYCRDKRRPVFLHLRTVRLLGHAGSDPETEYHSFEQIEAAEASDPLLATARFVLEAGAMKAAQVLERYDSIGRRVREAAEYAAKTAKQSSAASIMHSLAPYTPDAVAKEAARAPRPEDRVRVFGSPEQLPERASPRHMAVLINQGLHDALIKYPEALIFGEDVAKKGGVYHVTTGLSAKFGVGRVFNTLLDETMILGMGIGAAHMGLLPIPEIQYLAYYHNAEDQVRGEACSLQYFSDGRFRNPMVIRIAGWAYQKGFGGHFHNDNSIAALRDVPGLIVCTPSRGDDAVKMMRTCLAMAKVDGRVVAFIEPIALYMTRDLHEAKDGLWSFNYPPPGEFIPFGEGAVYTGDMILAPGGARSEPRPAPLDAKCQGSGSGQRAADFSPRGRANAESVPRPSGSGSSDDLTILTFANGVPMSLRAAKSLHERDGIRARVVDLRWLTPLNESFIAEQARATGRVLIVDEGRRTGGVGEAIMTAICEQCASGVTARRITAHDTYIPLGPAADHVLPQQIDIENAALELLGESRKPRHVHSSKRR
jgi:2-oxoisovalerate dehydrogenase E1 component